MVKFGQSIRMYILKGASSEGVSAAKKKSWGRVKLRPPKVSISGVLPKMPSRPRISAPITKLVNDVCYGTMTDEKMDTFITAVLELPDDEKKVLQVTMLFFLSPSNDVAIIGRCRGLQISWSRKFKRSTSFTQPMYENCIFF